MSYKKQKFILILFIIITAMSICWYGCSQESDKEDVTYSLVKSDRGEYIFSSEGRRMALIPGALKGFIEELRTDDEGHVYIFGWAFDAKNSRLPDVILISHNGKIIFRGQNNQVRPGVAKSYGKVALGSGFRFKIPEIFKHLNIPDVRLFAISNDVASEIIYLHWYRLKSHLVLDCPHGSGQCHKVLDCSIDPGKCLVREIEFNIKGCNTKGDKEKCKKSKEGLKEVSLIADPSNFISSPFTEEKFTVEMLKDGLRSPWDLEFLPDGSMMITEQHGKIIHMKGNSFNVVYNVEPVGKYETGLLGLAIDPEFSTNKYVYIYYTYKLDNTDPAFLNPRVEHERRVVNKIVRLTFDNERLKDEVVLLDNIPGSYWHSGARLEFGPDGKLYATTGDAAESLLAQNESFLGGKILRLNRDGTVPTDNPFPYNYTYSMGHRNPQGLAWHPITNELYESEHGPVRYDEINHIRPGQNYGWGSFKCDEKNSDIPAQGKVTFPIICFKEWTMAPSGIEFVEDPESPWFANLFVASLRGKHLHRYVFDNDKIVKDEIFFVADAKAYINDGVKGNISLRIRDVEFHNGSLYVIGDQFGLIKITPK